MREQTTALLQNWLKTVVITPGYLRQKLDRAQQIHGLQAENVVSEEGEASMYRRLNVYSSGYLMRLLECMYADYAVLKKFTGDEVFDGFAKAYLLYHPSTSFTLHDLGKAFPDFLDKTRPSPSPALDLESNTFMALPVAMAKLERARQEAKRAQGTETKAAVDSIISIEDILLNSITVEFPSCLTLLELDYPINDFYEAVHMDMPYYLPQQQVTYLAISRKNYRITMTELSYTQYTLLQVCKMHGSFYEALSDTARICGIESANILADACKWLPMFREKGII